MVWGESSVGYDLARPARPARPARRALPRGRRRHPGERGRAPLRPARHLQELGAGRPARVRPATATTRCGWSPSASTSRPARCSAGPPRWARRRARTGMRGTEPVVMDAGGRAADRAAGLLRVGVPRHEPPSGAGRRRGAGRPVVDLDVPAELGAGAARLAGGAAGRRDRPADGARHAHRRQRRLRPAAASGSATGSAPTASTAEVYDVPLADGVTPVRPLRRLAGVRGAG